MCKDILICTGLCFHTRGFQAGCRAGPANKPAPQAGLWAHGRLSYHWPFGRLSFRATVVFVHTPSKPQFLDVTCQDLAPTHCGSSPRSLAALRSAPLPRFVVDTSHTTCPNSCLLISSHPSTGTGWHYPCHCSSQCLSSNLSQASHSVPWYGPSHSAVSFASNQQPREKPFKHQKLNQVTTLGSQGTLLWPNS